MNGMSTETYETLHKSNVKNPYHMTNKKNYILQMLNTVRHYYLAAKQKAAKPKSRSSSSFRNLLWEFNEGFDNLRAGFEEFLTENDINYDDQSGYFKIYSSVAVKSTDIIRTAASFYGNEWFSNVIVSSEETDWYGKVLLLLEFFVEKDKELINLVLL
ncbi:hypothetical protein GLOIN_2v1803493 [Rhizophagus clarus]|uniref:Uncharacterized protein n=1 Tax=Rhizophagus clarus TaxID=94130 RepID=A0A8H3LS14_9GLOM|nr:hypothetical protein GLOIN_2v1803493 [Rhizophagus clarus]